jgi:glycosyltransferase involved in cell wall biosynthesis
VIGKYLASSLLARGIENLMTYGYAGVVFVTWGGHRRTSEIGRQFQLDVLSLYTPHRGLRRYLTLCWQTIRALALRRPRTVIVQSPSFVLCALAELLAVVLRFELAIDAHNEAVAPYIYNYGLVRWGARLLLRHADLVIVTNDHLFSQVKYAGAQRVAVLPDPIPVVPTTAKMSLGSGAHVVFICTFARDEPVEEVIQAARLLGPTVTVHVTGTPGRRRRAVQKTAPANVRFWGYLAEEEYWALLASAHVIVDLTLIPSCLVCGAYEAMALGQPLVLSDDLATRETFTTAAVYANPNADSIAAAIARVLAERAYIVASIPAARAAFQHRWDSAAECFATTLNLPRPCSLTGR